MNGIVRDQITVFRLKPYSWLLPHFGPHNDRLIWHLCIMNCKGPKLRVGNTWREWEEGKVIVFDDSFEHEVQWPRPGQPLKKYGVPPSEMDEAFIEADEENTTPVQGEPRYVLYMALQHPDTLAVPPEVPVFSLDDFRSLKLEL